MFQMVVDRFLFGYGQIRFAVSQVDGRVCVFASHTRQNVVTILAQTLIHQQSVLVFPLYLELLIFYFLLLDQLTNRIRSCSVQVKIYFPVYVDRKYFEWVCSHAMQHEVFGLSLL